jgi:hypothetical protein
MAFAATIVAAVRTGIMIPLRFTHRLLAGREISQVRPVHRHVTATIFMNFIIAIGLRNRIHIV